MARWYRPDVRLPVRIALLASLLALPNAAWAEPERWPSWPSEVDRAAWPLLDADAASHDRDRTTAVIRLQEFPTPLIEDALQIALDDPSVQVVREALRICYLRRASVCLPAATKRFRDEREPSLRAAALRVLATDPRGERLDLMLEALLDPSETVRAEAAQLAGWAPLRGEALERTRRALLAKLSDSASAVRDRAVTALGLQGPADGTLAIARLLEDPEPSVRASAATALGHLHDPRAEAALLRAIEGQNEGNVTRAMLTAYARIPGASVGQRLLGFLDDPPPGVGTLTVAEAIGDRPAPDPELIDGLVERLRDDALEEAARRALLFMGEDALPRLEAALARGLGPRLDAEVRRLVLAVSPLPSQDISPDLPDLSDRAAWVAALTIGPPVERMRHAAALGSQDPPWLVGLAHARIGRGSFETAQPFILALASMPRPVSFRDDTVLPWSRLAHWALDHGRSVDDRCVATLALGRAGGRRARAQARATLEALAGDPSAQLRTCVVWAARDLAPELTAQGVLDDDARPRAAAALLLGSGDRAAALQARRAHLGIVDPDPHVRAAALAAVTSGPPELVIEPLEASPWAEPALWMQPDGVWVPALGSRPGRWGLRLPVAQSQR